MIERRAESGYPPLKAVKRLNGMSRDLFDEVLSERKFLTKRTLFKNNESRTPGPSFLIHHPVSGRHEFVGLTPELFVIEREREREGLTTIVYPGGAESTVDVGRVTRDRISSIRKISTSGEEARAEAKIVSMIYLTTVSPVRSKKLARRPRSNYDYNSQSVHLLYSRRFVY